MNRDEFERDWHQLKGKIQERWDKFTHEDLARINGKFEKFIEHLLKKYGYTKEHAEKEVKNWQHEEPRKKGHSKYEAPLFGGEERPSDILAHERLAHEDKDPIYPFQPIQGGNGPISLKAEDKHKKKHNDQGHKDKKRKAG